MRPHLAHVSPCSCSCSRVNGHDPQDSRSSRIHAFVSLSLLEPFFAARIQRRGQHLAWACEGAKQVRAAGSSLILIVRMPLNRIGVEFSPSDLIQFNFSGWLCICVRRIYIWMCVVRRQHECSGGRWFLAL